MNQFVYHFRPKDMSGEILYPLNSLKATLPQTFEEAAKKYAGREFLMEKRIPTLDCLWNDVLHLSPINPQIVMNTWREEGIYDAITQSRVHEIEVFKVPVRLLNPDTTTCFQSFNFDPQSKDESLMKYWNFDSEGYREQTAVSKKQIQVWRNDLSSKQRVLWYSHTLHILAKQSIDTRECELIVCR